ncbi:MAG: GNAT family N-acetyltransferase [Thermaurantimonas sp.]
MKKALFRFYELSAANVYEILRIRNEIFVLEQRSIYNDTDGWDYQALHYTYTLDDRLIAYSRILPPGTVYSQASIGRVCVRQDMRNRGLGRSLFTESLTILESVYGRRPVKIQAQLYLQSFYQSFGFEKITDPYDDCGILHVDMIRH